MGGIRGIEPCRYQQEPFENAAQDNQRASYEHIEMAAALATSRTAAQMTSVSKITSVSALEFQRHSLVIVMLKVNPVNFNNLNQSRDKIWNDEIQSLYDEKSRDGVTRTVAEFPAGACSDQCSYESNSDFKQFDEHQKLGDDAAIADVKP